MQGREKQTERCMKKILVYEEGLNSRTTNDDISNISFILVLMDRIVQVHIKHMKEEKMMTFL